MTRAGKSLLFSFLTFAALLLAGVYTLHSTRFHNFLLSFIQRATGWKVKTFKSEIHILRTMLVLKGFDAEDPKGRIHITGERLLFNLSALSLLRGKLVVSDLEVDHPLIDLSKLPPTAGPEPDFLSIGLPHAMNQFFRTFDRSLLLQNLILERIDLRDVVLIRYGDKTTTLKDLKFAAAANLLRQIEVGAHLEGVSGLSDLESADIEATLNRSGLNVKRADIDFTKVKLSVSGTWKGTLEKGELALDGGLQAPTVLSEPLHFAANASVEKSTAVIKKLEAQLGKATFQGKGSFQVMKRIYELTFTAKDLPLEAIFSKMPSPILGPAKGMATVEGKASGQFPNLEAKAKATIEELHHTSLHAGRVDGLLDFHWPELDWEADIKPAAGGPTQGHVKGGVAFKILAGPEYEGKRKATLKTLDLTFAGGSLRDLVPTLNVSGSLDAQLLLKGVSGTTSADGTGHAKVTNGHWFLGDVPSLTTEIAFHPHGKIVFTKTEIQLPTFSTLLWPNPINLDTSGDSVLFSGQPTNGFSIKGRYEKESGYFHIDSYEIAKSGTNLKGSLGLRRGGAVEGKMLGALNLSWLSAFPAFFRDADGIAQVDLSLSGTTHQPALKGKVEFNNDDIQLRNFPELSGLTGTLGVDGPTVTPKISGYLGDGKFDLSGHLSLEGTKPQEFDLALRGRNLTYSRPNTYHIDFDADVTLKGRMPSPRLEGRIDVVDGRYTKPFVIRELVLKPFEEETLFEPDPWQAALAQLELKLSIKNSGDLRIKNNIADILLFSALDVEGTYGRPKIGGALTSSEGQLTLFGENFALNEGRLEYIDPARQEPYLTLVAQQDINSQYTVNVEVKGFLSNLALNLTSTPSLPREDILSLLTAGVTQEELRQSGRSLRSVGSGVLAGEISGIVERPVARKTGLDVFRLEASDSGSLTKMAVGKNVTDRLTLEFQSDFAPETAQRSLQANYYLTDNILLKGNKTWESTSLPNYNLNISFRFRLF